MIYKEYFKKEDKKKLSKKFITASNASWLDSKVGSLTYLTGIKEQVCRQKLGIDFKDFKGNFYTERGNDNEYLALQYYCNMNNLDEMFDIELDCQGLVNHTLGILAKPDGLIGDNGIIEVKTRIISKQFDFFDKMEAPKENIMQLKLSLLASKREYIDYVSFCPELESKGLHILTKRYYRKDFNFVDLIKKIKLANINIDKFYNEKIKPIQRV